MAQAQGNITQFLNDLPAPDEVRRRLTENLREARLLRQILKLSEQREKVREVQK